MVSVLSCDTIFRAVSLLSYLVSCNLGYVGQYNLVTLLGLLSSHPILPVYTTCGHRQSLLFIHFTVLGLI